MGLHNGRKQETGKEGGSLLDSSCLDDAGLGEERKNTQAVIAIGIV